MTRFTLYLWVAAALSGGTTAFSQDADAHDAAQGSAGQLSGQLSGQLFGQAPGELTAAATWMSCATCHATPDRRVPHDARWIGLNRTTLCLTGKAAEPTERERLIRFLNAGEGPRPELFTPQEDSSVGPQEVGVEAAATVRVPAISGSAFLRRTDTETPKTIRLFWPDRSEASVIRIPEGAYDLIGYCFYRSEEDGTAWTASATIQEGTEADRINAKEGAATKLPISPKMYHDLTVTADGTDLGIKFQMRNEAGDRMTLTRDNGLVEPSWIAYSENRAATLASGRFVPN